MKGRSFGAFLSFITILGLSTPLARAQTNALKSVDWALHNLDLAGSRFSAMDQINRSNVKSLVPRWLFQHGVIDGVSNQTTPVIVDGTMYVTDSRGSVYAVNAADGHLLWTYDVTNLIGGGAREGLRVPQPRCLLRERCHLHGSWFILVRARFKDGQAYPGFRHRRPGQCDSRCAQDTIPGRQDGYQPRILVHDCTPGVRRRALHRQHTKREPHPRRPCACRRC